MFSVDFTFPVRFVTTVLLSMYMIWDQLSTVLIQTAALTAPGQNDDWAIMGLNGSYHRVTEIDVCRGAWSCGRTRCQFYQNPNVSMVLFAPFDRPVGPCDYSLTQAFTDVWRFPAGLMAMCFLGVASVCLGLWSVCVWWQAYVAWILYCVSRVSLVGAIITVSWMLPSGDAPRWVSGLGISFQVVLGMVCLLELVSTLQVLCVNRTRRSTYCEVNGPY
jgi:hypothetical protein